MLDAHNHLQFAAFDDDRNEAIARAAAAGVTGMVLAGYDSARREFVAELGARPGMGGTAGLHPWAITPDSVEAELAELHALDWTRFCGVGELGLDWGRATSPVDRALQIDVFRQQLAIARAIDLPIVVHSVRANDDVAKWLAADGLPGRGGMIHSFWGSAEQAKRFVSLGLHLSIGTQLTYGAPAKMRLALEAAGIGRVLVETDAPSRPPAGVGTERNEPSYLPCVVKAVALTLGTEPDVIAHQTEHNARVLFDLRGHLALSESQ